MLVNFLYVMLGSALGGGLRYSLLLWTELFLGKQAFWGLLSCNIIGCFLAGLIFAYSLSIRNSAPMMLFLVTGIMGGFTSFSAFGLDFYKLISTDIKMAFLYVFLTVLGSLGAIFLGIYSFGATHS